jgi:hypothetical protein
MPRQADDWYLSDTFHTEVFLGAPCLFRRHSVSNLEPGTRRYKDTQACVHCVQSLTRPTLSLDINVILPDYRFHFIEFWSMVDIRGPDDCWPHQQRTIKDSRHWPKIMAAPSWLKNARSNTYAPYRIASWFSWGDTGFLTVKPLCGNLACCNPLHIQVQHVPHFRGNVQMDRLNLVVRAERHLSRVQEALQESRAKPASKMHRRRLETMRSINPEWMGRLLDESQGGIA